MKMADGCKLFGAQQALSGLAGGVVLLHSVVGCNFGSLALHVPCHMADIRQTCTVIADSDVVFGGGASLARALRHVEELYAPEVIFVVTGCVADIIQDDVGAVIRDFQGTARVIHVEAAGYRGRLDDGYEAALDALCGLLEPRPPAEKPTVNLIGFGADDPRLEADRRAFQRLLGEKTALGAVLCGGSLERLRQAPAAGLNLVLGRGAGLARQLERRFGMPWRQIDYPYGLTGAEALWSCLEERFGLDYAAERAEFSRITSQGFTPVYAYLQALYGMPVSVIGRGARARGMARFLTQELGMEVVCQAEREQLDDLEDFYDRVRASETALLFGSSFEQEVAEQLEIPLFRYDFPVFDRVSLTDRPLIGAEGSLSLVEELLNEIMAGRRQKGALYQ